MSVLSLLAAIFGVGMSLANFPQAYRIFKRKSAKDLSFTTWIIFTIGSFVWFLYGIQIGDAPIIWSYSVGTLSCLLVLIGWFKYR